jgi:hypothetical protein
LVCPRFLGLDHYGVDNAFQLSGRHLTDRAPRRRPLVHDVLAPERNQVTVTVDRISIDHDHQMQPRLGGDTRDGGATRMQRRRNCQMARTSLDPVGHRSAHGATDLARQNVEEQ